MEPDARRAPTANVVPYGLETVVYGPGSIHWIRSLLAIVLGAYAALTIIRVPYAVPDGGLATSRTGSPQRYQDCLHCAVGSRVLFTTLYYLPTLAEPSLAVPARRASAMHSWPSKVTKLTAI